ncbi:MAG: acetyltransferase [Allomuricauda sp.]|nr:MAG: acetyltransferase [Allomuricauda sp.]
MDVSAYLDRIDFKGIPKIDKATLFKLQSQHLLHVPFENLDIHYNRKIQLNLEGFFEKIVTQKRGGFCYELNGLFAQLLIQLGFEVRMISARVHVSNETYGPEFDHMALLVDLNDSTFLCDVGFGAFTQHPLKFVVDDEQHDPSGTFCIDRYDEIYYRVLQLEHGEKSPQYLFTTKPYKLADFEGMCHYHQTSPKSHFRQKKVVSKVTKKGRITLNDTRLKITRKGISEETNFEPHDFETYLKHYFGMALQTQNE